MIGWVRAASAVARRPGLWATVWWQWRVLTPNGWWRRRPYLPVPDRDWMRFRMVTAYGDADAAVDAHDLVVWLEWARSQRDRARRETTRRGGRAAA